MEMRVAITGSGGFLGSRIVSYYQNREFTGQSRMEFLPLKHQEIVLTDEEALKRFWESRQPDVLICCGAVSDTKACMEAPEASFQINVEVPKTLAKVCREYHVKMLFCSSDQVYFKEGEKFQKEHFHTEDERVQPKGIYGQQKLRAEQEILDRCPEAVVLRLSWLYDWKSYEKEHGTLVSAILDNVQNGRSFQYPVYDFRSITNVWEMVRNLEPALKLPGGVYNFGSRNEGSTYEIACKVMELLSADKSLLSENREAFGDCPRNIRMDMKKAEGYDISFLPTWEGMREAFKEFKRYSKVR